MTKNITAIMPIKLNNERLPGKNTKVLGGKPLIHYALEALLDSAVCDEINVFCSDPSIKVYLPRGVNYLQRNPTLDLPESNFSQIFEMFSKLKPSEIYLYAHATAPYVSVASIQSLTKAVCSGLYDSAFTATKIQDYLWQDGQPLNFNAKDLPRSQDLIPIFRESSGVYVFTKEVFSKYKRRIGHNPFILEISFREAIDINTFEDFALAETLLHAKL